MFVTQSCLTLCNSMYYRPSEFPGILHIRILEWIAYSLLQGIFTIQGSNPGLLHCRQILYRLSHQEKQRWFDFFLPCYWPSPVRPKRGLGSPLTRFVCVLSHSVMSDSLQPHGLQSSRLLCQWDFPGKNTGARCHFQLQGIFLTQGSTGVSCTDRQVLYCWATWEAPLPGVACPNRMRSTGHSFP